MQLPPLPGAQPEPTSGTPQAPQNERVLKVTDQTRISATMPVRQLEVPEIPGHVLYWFADRAGRVNWALRVGYEFVSEEEVQLNNRLVGSDTKLDGNNDMGTRVSVHGGEAERGGSERLYLMKIKKEWWSKDRQAQAEAQKAIVATLSRGMVGAEKETANNANKRYTRNNIFTPKPAPR